MEDDIPDMAIDMDEVNECFERGLTIEGSKFLERFEKQVVSDRLLEKDEEKIIRAFDIINRKVSKGKKHIEILSEFEKFGFSSETLLRLGSMVINASPKTTEILGREKSDKSEERYADDFEDYDDSDFEAEDSDEIDNTNMGYQRRAQTSNVYPTYTEKEPTPHRSKSAPSGVEISSQARAMMSSPALAPIRASKFKTTSWIQRGQWRLGEKIGSGAFGEVFQGMSDDGFLFAVKRMNITNHKEVHNLTAEIELMQTLSHPNIVMYLGAKVDEDQGVVYIFQEWVPGGSVAGLLQRFGPFSVGVVRTYTAQILCGLLYLHTNGIVHRDIKGGNILVDDAGHVKLADFGASTTMAFGETQETTTIKGTPYFMAPEVLAESKYGRRGDIWAVGCTIIQMLTGDPPWKDRKLQTLIQLHMLLSTWEGIPPIDRDIPDDLRIFLERCFEKDAKNRPMADELLGDPFLQLSDEELSESIGESGNSGDIRQQLERVAARASYRPNDTLGDIDSRLAAKRYGKDSREGSSSPSSGNQGYSSSPSHSNPFSKPSSAASALAAVEGQASPIVAPNPYASASSNPFASGGVRSSSSTPTPRVVQSQAEDVVYERQERPRRAKTTYDEGTSRRPPHYSDRDTGPRRRGSGSSQGSEGSSGGEGRQHRRVASAGMHQSSPRDSEETEITPRSHHSGRKPSRDQKVKPMRSSTSASSLRRKEVPRQDRRAPRTAAPTQPTAHTRSSNGTVGSGDSSGPKVSPRTAVVINEDGTWRCLNKKCGELNLEEDDACFHCAIKKGATGERGAGAYLFAG